MSDDMTAGLRVAVVGHVEWVRFARVDHVPPPGGITHSVDSWDGTGGGGAVSAVQLANLAEGSLFLTALGRDRIGGDAREELERRGVDLHAAERDAPTRTALTMVDDAHERTIVTIGDRLEPRADDDLPWGRLEDADAVYFTAGDPEALRRARKARVLVATARVLDVLAEGDVPLDAVIGSARDPAEVYDPSRLRQQPDLLVRTEGPRGGTWRTSDGRRGRYEAGSPPGEVQDAYGAGDCFQAGLTFGLASGLDVEDAVALAARCGAWAAAGRGPTGGQLTAADL